MATCHSKIAAFAAISLISVSAFNSFSDGFLKEAGKDAWQFTKSSVRPFVMAQNDFQPYDDSYFSGKRFDYYDTATPHGTADIYPDNYGGAILRRNK